MKAIGCPAVLLLLMLPLVFLVVEVRRFLLDLRDVDEKVEGEEEGAVEEEDEEEDEGETPPVSPGRRLTKANGCRPGAETSNSLVPTAK
eukprot:evm.model.NODE_19310_length_24751_cov_15.882955.3